MATKEPTQKAKLTMRAIEHVLSTDTADDYYLRPKLQKCLTMDDLAAEVAALSTRQEDPEDIARTGRQLMQRMMWFLSSGYSISLPIGYFHLTAQGVFMKDELNAAPDRNRLKLGVSYSMSEEMRNVLAEAEIDVDIQKSASGPQLFAAVSGQDAQNPTAATKGEGVPISGGQTVIIKGKNLKVGGDGAEIGITITRVDEGGSDSFFFPPSQLYPNTPSKVGFVMPASAPEGSVWGIKLCTQFSNNGSTLLKAPRTVEMDDTFVVGEVSAPTPGGGSGEEGEEGSFG
ncbi:MAG TPA: DUF4469 domain-containing protein [Candidatus Bacteroides intestinavium]|uniref:DUF4469 domain-containing protein n=1 Tax=Candidatus Bacteroides intestinavium TaxID=2838469 RepID=A0A9D2HS28_9BACE|nr:DUF4469 domain-containing protein [Candidatus Bacteroides intestinavium]